MRFGLFAIVALCLVAASRCAEEEYEYEEVPAAPVTKAPTRQAVRSNILSARGRTNNLRKSVSTTTTTTTVKPVEEEIYDEGEEGVDEVPVEEEEEVVATTTPAPKKKGILYKPLGYQMNQAYLAVLAKKRTELAMRNGIGGETASVQTTEATTSKPKSSSSNSGRKSGGTGQTGERTPTRGRFNPRSKPVQEEVDEASREEVQTTSRPRTSRRGYSARS